MEWSGRSRKPTQLFVPKKAPCHVYACCNCVLNVPLSFVCRSSPQFRPAASAMFSPAIPTSWQLSTLPTHFWGHFQYLCLYLAMRSDHCSLSPLKCRLIDRFLAPLSELYGRTPIIHAGNIIFTIFQIGCAESNSIACLIVLRLFSGIGGCAVLSVGGGVISDTFPKEKMGGATAAFSLGPLLGPVVGPVMYFSM
jgi:MFS family permease